MSCADYAIHGQIAVITLNNPPVNGISFDLRCAVVAGIDQASRDPAVNAIIITGSERAFSGGADIREFGSSKAYAEPNLPSLIDIVESCQKPVIAAIAGVCMGGGFELALGCHFRLVRPETKIALPEVKLGLIPGAGATQRLPRLLGVEAALNLMLKGDPVPASHFKGSPLFDAYIDGELLPAALAFAERVIAEKLPLRRVSQMKIDYPQHEAFLQFARTMVKGIAGAFPAPQKCIDAVAAAINLPFHEGIANERAIFLELMNTPESRALRHVFAAERAASKIADVPDDTPTRAIHSVGIIGAGTMGSGIAISFMNAGLPVVLLESKPEALDRGVAMVRKSLDSALKKGKLSAEKHAKQMASLKPSLEIADLAACDLIIEAVFESMAVKETVFRQIDAIAKPGAILASNTSTLDLDRIANFTARPQDVVGMHFFSPANVMKLLEVVRGRETARDVLASVMALAKTLRKTAVVSGVCDGFIGNRMILQYARVAQLLVDEGASPAQIDRSLEKFGMLMGPFRMIDLAGNDIGWEIRKRHYVERPEIRYSTLADTLCEAGRFGQKTGSGWYAYPQGARDPAPDPEVDAMISTHRAKLGIRPRKIGSDEIVMRCIYALINEGARLLDEGIAARASDIDMVFLTGYGFPLHRGGPMRYADEIGLYKLIRGLQRLQAESGDPFWEPAPLLVKRAADAKSLT